MARIIVRRSLFSLLTASANGTTGPPGVVSTPGGGSFGPVIVSYSGLGGSRSSSNGNMLLVMDMISTSRRHKRPDVVIYGHRCHKLTASRRGGLDDHRT